MSDTHAQTVPFVRDTMLPPQDPPLTQSGAIKWLRENLFSGWLNTLLTLASLYFIYWFVSHVGPWFANTVWNAGSLAECRQILDGVSGACFAVIKERWNQLLYGFYPPRHYWRPNLALVLLLVALAPLLFTGLPRRMLWFSAAYPFVAYWLLWGGTIWLPIVVAAGFFVGWAAWRSVKPLSELGAIIAMLLAALMWWFVVTGPLVGWLNNPSLYYFGSPGGTGLGFLVSLGQIGIQPVRSDAFGGFMLSIIIGFTGIALSLPMGVLLALGRQSDMFLLRTVCIVFIEFIRGVPLITLLFTASLLLNYFLPPGTSFDLILRVIIMVTIFAAAYIAEVVRGGLAALPRGQYEAADSLGLDYWKAQRLIIMPQALKISIPGIVNTFIGLFKDTTLVVFIGLLDPIGLSNSIRANTNWNGIYWELFIFIGALFFIFCFSISRYSMYLERKLNRGHR